jgi:beta-phosphoglucomutase-like phosphatase (HAD superfamily)
VSADQVGKGKPNPEVFLEAARLLGFPLHEIAVFEDSSAGIEAAARAGMWTVAVPNAHYPPTEEALGRADLVLDSLVDFRRPMFP